MGEKTGLDHQEIRQMQHIILTDTSTGVTEAKEGP